MSGSPASGSSAPSPPVSVHITHGDLSAVAIGVLGTYFTLNGLLDFADAVGLEWGWRGAGWPLWVALALELGVGVILLWRRPLWSHLIVPDPEQASADLVLPAIERLLAALFAAIAVWTLLGGMEFVGRLLLPFVYESGIDADVDRSAIVSGSATLLVSSVLFFYSRRLAQFWCRHNG